MRRVFPGSWQDTADAAVKAAIAEWEVPELDYILCEFSEGYRLEPAFDSRPAIDVEVVWSETRQQYKAVLRKLAR